MFGVVETCLNGQMLLSAEKCKASVHDSCIKVSDLAWLLNVCLCVFACSACPWSCPIGGYCSKCAFARARRLDIVANAHLLAHFRLLEATSTHACLVQHNNLSGRLSIVLFVCMGCVCVCTCLLVCTRVCDCLRVCWQGWLTYPFVS